MMVLVNDNANGINAITASAALNNGQQANNNAQPIDSTNSENGAHKIGAFWRIHKWATSRSERTNDIELHSNQTTNRKRTSIIPRPRISIERQETEESNESSENEQQRYYRRGLHLERRPSRKSRGRRDANYRNANRSLHPRSSVAAARQVWSSNRVDTIDEWQMRDAENRMARVQVNSAVFNSDTFSILCDINLHRWIVWLINHSFLLPRIFIPSYQHFSFGSVHDVSNLVQQYEDPTGRRLGIEANNCLFNAWQSGVVRHCTTAPTTTQPLTSLPESIPPPPPPPRSKPPPTFPPVPGDDESPLKEQPPPTCRWSGWWCRSLSAVGDTDVGDNEIGQNGASSQSPMFAASPTSPKVISPASYCSAEYTTVAIEAIPGPSSSVHAAPENGQSVGQMLDMPIVMPHSVEHRHHQAPDDFTASDMDAAIGGDHVWFTFRSIVLSLTLLAITLRYVLHFALIMFEHARSLDIIWCPLILEMLYIVATAISSLYINGKKFSIEDLTISSASFLKPFGPAHRKLILWLPRLYYALNVTFILFSLAGSMMMVTQFGTSDPQSAVILNGTFGGAQTKPIPHYPPTPSHWHLFDSYWLVESTNSYFGPKITSSATVRVVPNNSPVSLIQWPFVYGIDLAIRLWMFYILVLAKTFFFSISLIIIFKCVQLCKEVKFKGPTLTQLNRANQPSPSISPSINPSTSSTITTARCGARGSDSSSHNTPSPVQNQENERLSILTQVLLDIIRRYEHAFVILIVIWLLISLTIMVGLAEYYICYREQIVPVRDQLRTWWWWWGTDGGTHQNEAHSPFRQSLDTVFRDYEVWFQYYQLAVHALDFTLVIMCVLIIRCYRYRLLRN